MSNADELLKLKELLDNNIITQYEFEKKKNELLNKKTSFIKEETLDTKNNDNIGKNINKNNVSKIISYVFSIFFILSSLGQITLNNYIGVIILFLIGLVLLPPFNDFLYKKLNIRISGGVKAIICIILFFIYTMNSSFNMPTVYTNDNIIYQKQSNIVFDLNQFYKSNKTDTITPEELIIKKGEPSSIENWNYELNENVSYPIITYTYSEDEEEYNFYNGKLSYILITKEIPYKNKSLITSMFGLSTNNSQKTVDTSSTLRYKNCGVNDFWVQGFDNNTFNWVKIKLVESVF